MTDPSDSPSNPPWHEIADLPDREEILAVLDLYLIPHETPSEPVASISRETLAFVRGLIAAGILEHVESRLQKQRETLRRIQAGDTEGIDEVTLIAYRKLSEFFAPR